MSLTVATVITALILLSLGGLFLLGNSAVSATMKAFPRSRTATLVFFGGGAAWFLYQVANMSVADVIGFSSPTPFVFIFGALALLSFIYLPEFLAVRGASIIVLVGSWPLLMAAYQLYDVPQRLFMVSVVYVAVTIALCLAAWPYRLRDFFEWLYRVPQRARVLGGVLMFYGLLLAGVSFTY